MDVRLTAYQVEDDWVYPLNNFVNATVYAIPDDGIKIYYNPTLLPETFLDEIDSLYGLLWRTIEGLNDDNQYTRSYITDWGTEDFAGSPATFIQVHFDLGGVWSNQKPKVGSTTKVPIRFPKIYINGIVEDIGIGNDLVEDSLTITKQIESIQKFDLRVSSASFDVCRTDALESFLNKYWTAEKYNGNYHVIAVTIQGKFWGFVKPENIILDEDGEIYSFDCYDWIKLMQETIWTNLLPHNGLTPNLTDWLEDNVFNFNGIVINVNDTNLNWNYREYIGHAGDDEHQQILVLGDGANGFNVQAMITEILKHYGAVIYYTPDKKFHFTNRNKYNSDFHSQEDLIEDTLIRSYALRDWNSLLINAEGQDWGSGFPITWNGWALVWLEDNALQIKTGIDADLDNIKGNFKFLDLRQKLPNYDFEYLLFPVRTPSEVLSNYKELLENKKSYEADSVKVDYALFDTIQVGGKFHRITYIEEDVDNETSRIRFEEYA